MSYRTINVHTIKQILCNVFMYFVPHFITEDLNKDILETSYVLYVQNPFQHGKSYILCCKIQLQFPFSIRQKWRELCRIWYDVIYVVSALKKKRKCSGSTGISWSVFTFLMGHFVILEHSTMWGTSNSGSPSFRTVQMSIVNSKIDDLNSLLLNWYPRTSTCRDSFRLQ